MDPIGNVEQREATQRTRRRPGEPVRVTVGFGSEGQVGQLPTAPTEFMIEATNSEGEIAFWLDDYWWTDLFDRWIDDPVTVHIAPTVGALLHPVVLHQMEMVCRVAPRWRCVGHAYRGDVFTEDAVEVLSCSAYHEVRFTDQARPGSPKPDRSGADLPLDELFGKIRREQVRLGASRPVLIRLPAKSSV